MINDRNKHIAVATGFIVLYATAPVILLPVLLVMAVRYIWEVLD